MPTESVVEVTRFQANPVEWLQEWNEKNGMVTTEQQTEPNRKVFVVSLWVDGEENPISTGVAPTLMHAFINAITGIDSIPGR